ncbi:hypothetical protein VNO78_06347 [Psophocarpus tetragonolobus]|uniref:non-specific serine/threonine protein kinase n=1 Tax=Psophocarpus tetragonolobus TaxID=3891 RepID=A0AAN9SUX9_PSOTE
MASPEVPFPKSKCGTGHRCSSEMALGTEFASNGSLISRIVLNETDYGLRRFIWAEESQKWELYMTVPGEYCDEYNHCGSFGYCAMMGKTPICECLNGFEPKWPQNWVGKNWTQGCVLSSKSWRCKEKNKDGFLLFSNMKVPDTNTSWISRDTSVTPEECRAQCWENCSCTAYGNSDITGKGSGCILWFGHLLDLTLLPNAGQDLYLRLDISQIAIQDAKGGSTSKKVAIVVTILVRSITVMLVIFILVYCYYKYVKQMTGSAKSRELNHLYGGTTIQLFSSLGGARPTHCRSLS